MEATLDIFREIIVIASRNGIDTRNVFLYLFKISSEFVNVESGYRLNVSISNEAHSYLKIRVIRYHVINNLLESILRPLDP
jgi:hypothetical protein